MSHVSFLCSCGLVMASREASLSGRFNQSELPCFTLITMKNIPKNVSKILAVIGLIFGLTSAERVSEYLAVLVAMIFKSTDELRPYAAKHWKAISRLLFGDSGPEKGKGAASAAVRGWEQWCGSIKQRLKKTVHPGVRSHTAT